MIQDYEHISNKIKNCESCEWCIPSLESEFLHCLLKGKQKGILEECESFKEKTGMHISI